MHVYNDPATPEPLSRSAAKLAISDWPWWARVLYWLCGWRR